MKSFTTIFIVQFLLITVISAIAVTKPYGADTHFLSDPEPIQTEWSGNPLDYAAGRIGLDVRGIELPRGYEGGYRFACRFPIIDYVSNRPLFMKQWTEDNAELIIEEQQKTGIGVVKNLLRLLDDEDLYNWDTSIINLPPDFKLDNSGFTEEYKKILRAFINSYISARNKIEKWVNAPLPDETSDYFKENTAAYLLPDGERMNSLTGNVDSQFEYIGHARKVRCRTIFYAAIELTEAIERYARATQKFKRRDFYSDKSKAKDIFQIESLGVAISGFNNDTHSENIGLLIDLGGNELYTNNAGGSVGSVAVVIDHNGNDVYNSDSRYVQGFGCLGVGYLVDLEGNDRYTAKHFSQGGGIMGVGCLWDNWGNDEYSGHGFTQGAAMFGLGALLDNSGDDKYDCATLGQGGATTLGLGICSDLSGDDEYLLNVTKGKDNMGSAGYGQGGALSFRHNPWNKKLTAYGGVGFLIDGNGDDSYHTKGWCDQGGSYIMSLGALYDGGGNDKYIANTGQGSGIHITNAILIDKSGNDNYQGGFRTGASGSDRSPGILIDYSGDDTYTSKSSCYGTGCKPFSFSLMIDYKGDDTYISPNPKGPILMNNWDAFGGVWPESASYLWPWAMCLDLGGKDDYQVRNRANNSERHSFGHGIHLDIEYEGGDIIGEVEKPLQFKDSQILDKIIRNNPETVDALNTLQSGSTFGSFRAIGKINSHSPDVVTDLVSVLLNSENRAFNRYVMECIQHFFSSDQITDEHVSDLQKLLKAKDPEVRTIMADNFGIWECSTTEGALIDALNDPEASVRRFSLSSLISLKSEAGLEHARKMAFDDPSEEVQRVCIVYISRMKEHVNAYPLLMRALKDDTAAAVKVAAASGLGSSGNQSAVGELKRASKSNDVYLQRAAGKALAELYQVEGIEILINSLTFPSIDAFYNYNRNVPNYLANYSGFNPPEKERYKQQLWLDWYTKNRDKIDIKSNVDAYNEYRVLQVRIASDIDSEKVRKLEQFLKKFPNHSGAGQFLASELNHIAWYMVTDAKGTPDWNPPLAVIFAERAVELSQEINYVDTLAEAYLADGRLNEAKMVCEKYPDNKMFTERLDRIKDSQDK
ncbi:MAG: hypothetical protein HN757_01075 [Calditrichaeota bacterium]|nr:hypothetical protein [Calditrichota bacterium]